MKYILVKNGDLLQPIAAKYLGDATLWPYIAFSNGLSDAKIQGMGVLLIPDVPTTLTGGILT
jgi:nucleoid-associated protein YgaU